VGRGFRDAGNADRRTRDPQVPKSLWLAASAPVVCNAVIIGLVLHFTLADVLLVPPS
jgi:hypothetical protein